MVFPVLMAVAHSQKRAAYSIACSSILCRGVGLHHKLFRHRENPKCSKTRARRPKKAESGVNSESRLSAARAASPGGAAAR